MSKIGHTGALDDGNVASVPGIEPSDINDGDILARTRENKNSNGQFQFVYIPADGTDPIVSDWIGDDFRKKVLPGWVDGVKAAIIGRGQAAMKEANAKARAARLAVAEETVERDMPTEDIVLPEPVGKRNGPAIRQSQPVRNQPASHASPEEYIRSQLEESQARLEAAEEVQNDTIREVVAARVAVNKWSKLAKALAGDPVGSDSNRDSSGRSTTVHVRNSQAPVTL